MLYGNFDLAGSGRFVSHILPDGEEKTLCGLVVSKLKGDWQFLDDENEEHAGCIKCRAKVGKRGKILSRTFQPLDTTFQ